MTEANAAPSALGIEALGVYCGLARLPARTLIEGRGLDPGRLANLAVDERSVALPFEDPVTHAVNAAKPVVDALSPRQRERIEILMTATESGVDYSKSVASYVHEFLGLHRNCRIAEVKQACYAATAAVQLAAGYLASAVSPGAKALVIATDVALTDARAQYAEPATGTGAAAILLSDDPRVLTIDLGAFGNYSYETMDSARPSPEFDIADVDTSLFAYLDCLEGSLADYQSRVDGADIVTGFDYLAMHTPFCGLVKAAHRKLMRGSGVASDRAVDEDYARRVAPSLIYPRAVGNLCSGSVYLALASIIDHAPLSGAARVGLFSYGSGCSSEFFSGVIDAGSVRALAGVRLSEHLAHRCELTFADYALLLKETLRCLVPEKHRTIDVAGYSDLVAQARTPLERPLLAFRGTAAYHRKYDWL